MQFDVKISGAQIRTYTWPMDPKASVLPISPQRPTKWRPLSRPGRFSANRDINASRTYPFGTPGHRALNRDCPGQIGMFGQLARWQKPVSYGIFCTKEYGMRLLSVIISSGSRNAVICRNFRRRRVCTYFHDMSKSWEEVAETSFLWDFLHERTWDRATSGNSESSS